MDCVDTADSIASGRSKCFTMLPIVHLFMNTITRRWRRQPRRAVRVRCLAQGHLDTRWRGAGYRTSNLPVTSQPALPPEPHAAHHHPCSKSFKKSRDFKAMPFTVQNYQNDAECTHQKINVPDLHLFTKVINTQRTLHLHLEDTFIQSDNRKNYISPSVQ